MEKVRVKVWERHKNSNIRNNFLSLDLNIELLKVDADPCAHPPQHPSKTKAYLNVIVLTAAPSGTFHVISRRPQTWMDVKY
jgi:hypothetical protein